MKGTKKSGKNATKTTKIAYPKTNVSVLEQTSNAPQTVQTSSFGTDLFEENNRIKQQIDEIKTKSHDTQQIDTSYLQPKLIAGNNISISNNIISATDTTYSAGTNISITNGVISATGGDTTALQSQIDNLQQQINNLKTPTDPNYNPQTPSDYPSGTIFQTYDFYERDLDMTTNSIIDLPIIYFCAEPESEGIIKLRLKFKVSQTATNLLITVTCNGNQLSQEVFAIDIIDNMYEYYKEYFGILLNQNDRGNNLSISISLAGSTSSSRSLEVTYIKAEFIAPNADILNKICPYDVTEINGMCYISDCSTGIAKTAQIATDKLVNINNLNWIDTGISAQNYKTGCTFQRFNTTYVVYKYGYLLTQKNNKFFTAFDDNSSSYLTAGAEVADWHYKFEDKARFIGIRDSKLNRFTKTDTYNRVEYYVFSINEEFANVFGVKFMQGFENLFSIPDAIITIDKNGNAKLRFSTGANSTTYDLGYASDVVAFYRNVEHTSKFTIDCYVKRYDKIFKYVINYQTNNFSLDSCVQIGSYDKIFALSNNGYIAIKYNKINYYKNN